MSKQLIEVKMITDANLLELMDALRTIGVTEFSVKVVPPTKEQK